MANTNETIGADSTRARAISRLPRRIAVAVIWSAVMLTMLLAISGRLWWGAAWILAGCYLVFLIAYVLWGTVRMPDLLEERGKPQGNAKRWDLILMRAVYLPVMISLFILCALDQRFKWSNVPVGVQIAGGALTLAAAIWIIWVLDTNRYASGVVRIQADRGHTVTTSGPYRIVRHPMYLGNVTMFVGLPLVLGSWYGLAISACLIAIFVVRISLEDRTLHEELEGYPQYASRVRSRLVPGIW
jgi:protein-S-isoprenylcysteine O-methyltransferase Ste14